MADRVLLLSYAFPPMSVPEAALSAKRMGNIPNVEVDVITVEPFRDSMGSDRSLDAYTNERFRSIERICSPTVLGFRPVARLGALVKLPDDLRLLNGIMRRKVRGRGLGDYAALLTWSQWHSIHLVGSALKRSQPECPPWIAHFSDPWSNNPFFDQDPLTARINRGLERRVIEAADRLLFTTIETVDLVMGRYPASWRTKVRVLPHAFDPSLYPPPSSNPRQGPFRLRYLGQFYGARTPEPLFRALSVLYSKDARMAEQIRVELIGRVDRQMLTTASYRSLPEGLVKVTPPVDYVDSLELMRSADLLLVIDASAAKSVFLPSKLVDYIGARRPILGITPPGAAASLIARLGGWVADPADPGAVMEALTAAFAWLRHRRDADFGDRATRTAYETGTIGRRMAEHLSEVRCSRARVLTARAAGQ